jgi:hypothetical protein
MLTSWYVTFQQASRLSVAILSGNETHAGSRALPAQPVSGRVFRRRPRRPNGHPSQAVTPGVQACLAYASEMRKSVIPEG